MSDWCTRHEIPLLRALAGDGLTPAEVHEFIPTHSPNAIRQKGYAIGLSWRRKGSRRGLVIGQPRSVSLASHARTAALRELILSGKVKPRVILARLALSVRTDAAWCPSCGKRPSHPASRFGLCPICHKEVLVEIQEEELVTIEAHKGQQNVWQKKSRARKDTLRAVLQLMREDPWLAESIEKELRAP